ncbi:MAG: flagellar protein FliS [Pseudomonadota bacterium]
MNTQYAVNKYTTAEMTYGNPIRTIITVYDVIIKLLYKAKKSIDEKDIANKCMSIQKASELTEALRENLDLDNGGKVAEILDDFYLGLFYKLHDLIIKNHGHSEIDEILDTIKKIQVKWQDALNLSYVLPDEDKKTDIGKF